MWTLLIFATGPFPISADRSKPPYHEILTDVFSPDGHGFGDSAAAADSDILIGQCQSNVLAIVFHVQQQHLTTHLVLSRYKGHTVISIAHGGLLVQMIAKQVHC